MIVRRVKDIDGYGHDIFNLGESGDNIAYF